MRDRGAGGRQLPSASDLPPPGAEPEGLFATPTHVRAILDSIPGAVLVVDLPGRILAFSPAAERMFGFAETELLGRQAGLLLNVPEGERGENHVSEWRLIGQSRVTTARHRDGHLFPIDLHVGETSIDGDRCFTAFVRDLSAKRIHDVQSELAHAARLSAIGGLATAIAHELNQPLTAIANYVHTLRDLVDSPRPDQKPMIEEAIDHCVEQSLRAGQLVRRLRDFVAHRERKRGIESLSRVVDEASALALVGTRNGAVEIRMQLDPEADRVKIDRIEVQQVVLNLVRNAAQALLGTPDPLILISSERLSDGQIRVTVEDNGPGIAADVAGRVFQPFVTTRLEGIGLGLSICQNIVEGYGGRIWTERSSLSGAAFHFTLPEAGEGKGA
jgi:two-component system sensor kinase FixL